MLRNKSQAQLCVNHITWRTGRSSRASCVVRSTPACVYPDGDTRDVGAGCGWGTSRSSCGSLALPCGSSQTCGAVGGSAPKKADWKHSELPSSPRPEPYHPTPALVEVRWEGRAGGYGCCPSHAAHPSPGEYALVPQRWGNVWGKRDRDMVLVFGLLYQSLWLPNHWENDVSGKKSNY